MWTRPPLYESYREIMGRKIEHAAPDALAQGSLGQRIEQFLIACASNGRTATYKELCDHLNIDYRNEAERSRVWNAMRGMDRSRHKRGLPILCVLVVYSGRKQDIVAKALEAFLQELGLSLHEVPIEQRRLELQVLAITFYEGGLPV